MIAAILKPYWVQIWAVSATGLSIFLLTRPEPVPVVTTKTEYIDRIVTKDVEKVVFKDVIKWRNRETVKTITTPSGTTIVKTTKETSGQDSKITGTEKAKEIDKTTVVSSEITTLPAPPRYLLGVNLTPTGTFSSSSVGIRLHSSIPVYVGTGVIRNPDSSYKLILSLGVTF